MVTSHSAKSGVPEEGARPGGRGVGAESRWRARPVRSLTIEVMLRAGASRANPRTRSQAARRAENKADRGARRSARRCPPMPGEPQITTRSQMRPGCERFQGVASGGREELIHPNRN